MDPQDLLTVGEAAKVLRANGVPCSPDLVRRYERLGRLPGIRVGNGIRLFERGAVEKLAWELAAARRALRGRLPRVRPPRSAALATMLRAATAGGPVDSR